jgi:putative sterol carrier protein
MTDFSQLSIQEVVERIPEFIKPEAIQGLDMVVQLRLDGDGGGNWHLVIKDGKVNLLDGLAEKPRVTVTSKADVFKDLLSGKTNITQAFMLGKIKITGDMAVAMKLVNLFK